MTKSETPGTAMPTRIKEEANNWSPAEQAWLHAFINAIQENYAHAVQRAVLLGSRARGDGHQWDDIDVLVIIRDEDRELSKEIEALSDNLPGADECLAAVLTQTESEWRKLEDWRAQLWDAVEREGISLLPQPQEPEGRRLSQPAAAR